MNSQIQQTNHMGRSRTGGPETRECKIIKSNPVRKKTLRKRFNNEVTQRRGSTQTSYTGEVHWIQGQVIRGGLKHRRAERIWNDGTAE